MRPANFEGRKEHSKLKEIQSRKQFLVKLQKRRVIYLCIRVNIINLLHYEFNSHINKIVRTYSQFGKKIVTIS